MERKIDLYNSELSIAKELGDKAAEGRSYLNLAIAYQSLGDFNQAIDYHKQRLSIAKELGQKDGEGRAYCNLGNAYYSLGDFKQATDYYKQDLNIAKELEDRTGEGRAYRQLGIAYQSLGDIKQAIDCHNQSLRIAKELGSRVVEGVAYGNLGKAYDGLGDFKQAIDYHKKDLTIAKEFGMRDVEGRAYDRLGIAYQNLGDFKQAIDYQQQRLSITKELGQRDGEGRAYDNLGVAYQSLGDFKQAIDYHRQHLSIAKERGNKSGEGRAYNNLGVAYDSLGDFEQAIDYHKQSLGIAKELGQRVGEGRSYGNLGNGYQILGDFKQAIDYHKKSLSIAKELKDRAGEGSAYGNLGNAYWGLGDFKQAIDYHKQHLSFAKELGQREKEGFAYYSLGCDMEFSGALHEALDYYQSSVKVYNEVRSLLQSEDTWKITFRNACQHAYTALWSTLLLLEKPDEALCVAEQGRAQALMDLLKLQYDAELLTSGTIQPTVTISDISNNRSTQIVFLALKGKTINLWVLCKGKSAQFRQKRVESEEAATFLERLRKDVFKQHQIGVRVTCENRSLDELRDNLPPSEEVVQETGRTDSKNDSLRLFYDYTIGPIADVLEGDELIIVPDGPLCLVPYAAFLDDESRYLSESIRVRICPSLTSLKLITDCAQEYHKTSGALLVGDPCLEEVVNKRGKPILSPLPFAKKEVETIGDMLDIPALTGRDATKDEVLRRIGSVALVHIAAHGDMEAGEIALAPNPSRTSKIPVKKDYMLKLSDVQTAKMHAKLVVLSCCHSAQGKVTPEGVVGIGRAFLAAGARSVLVALWAIDDEATMEFMKSFYTHLKDGNSASVALNRSMKCLRESEKFGAVKYWAPFVLIARLRATLALFPSLRCA
ncbi:tetratricopeptide repeat protein 28-like [Oculina patagonica]